MADQLIGIRSKLLNLENEIKLKSEKNSRIKILFREFFKEQKNEKKYQAFSILCFLFIPFGFFRPGKKKQSIDLSQNP